MLKAVKEVTPGKRRGWRSVLFSLLALLFVGFGPLIVSEVSLHYPEMYSYKEAKQGVFDNENVSFAKRGWVLPTGECSFYYDRWIVSDQDKGPQDGYIPFGKSWASVGYPLTGYASYKLEIIHALPGERIALCGNELFASANFFCNGQLLGHSGVVAKTREGNQIAGNAMTDQSFVIPNEGKFTFVCEIGYSTSGALGFKPALMVEQSTADKIAEGWGIHGLFTNYVGPLALAALLLMLGASITLLFVSKGKGLSSSFVYLLLAILFYYFVSADEGYFFFRNSLWVDGSFLERANPFGAALVLVALAFYLYQLGILPGWKKKTFGLFFAIYAGVAVGLGLLSGFTLGSSLSNYAMLAQWLLAIPLLFFAILSVSRGQKKSFAPFLITSLILGLLICSWLDVQEWVVWDLWGVPSVALCLIAMVGTVVYIRRDLALQKAFEEKEELSQRYLESKQSALKAQIKPHFIFNCLSAIEESYHQAIASGDRAMNLFALHLRSDVDSLDQELIPFEDELQNIAHYVELENLRLTKPFTILYDIETSDFEVPPLSLQPFVENAIKYSKANEKEDGFISLSVEVGAQKEILLQIEDNGVGFDVKSLSPSSQGLKNASERFALILGAAVTIESTPLIGTKIRIVIPPQKRILSGRENSEEGLG